MGYVPTSALETKMHECSWRGNVSSPFYPFNSKHLIVICVFKKLNSLSSTGSEDLGRIQSVFAEFWKHQIIDVIAVVQMKYGGIRIYDFEPYSSNRCAHSGPPILVNIWSARFNRFTWKNKPLYDRKKKVTTFINSFPRILQP